MTTSNTRIRGRGAPTHDVVDLRERVESLRGDMYNNIGIAGRTFEAMREESELGDYVLGARLDGFVSESVNTVEGFRAKHEEYDRRYRDLKHLFDQGLASQSQVNDALADYIRHSMNTSKHEYDKVEASTPDREHAFKGLSKEQIYKRLYPDKYDLFQKFTGNPTGHYLFPDDKTQNSNAVEFLKASNSNFIKKYNQYNTI